MSPKQDPKAWAQMFIRRWAELFAALSKAEQAEVMDDPGGHQAQALGRYAGNFATECMALVKPTL